MPGKYTRRDGTEYRNSVEELADTSKRVWQSPAAMALCFAPLWTRLLKQKTKTGLDIEFEAGDGELLQALAENGNLSYAKVLEIPRALGMRCASRPNVSL